MPLSTGHKNKMKQWRQQAETANKLAGRRVGRMLKYKMIEMNTSTAGASSLLIGMLQRAAVPMPSATAFAKYMKSLEVKSEAATPTTEE